MKKYKVMLHPGEIASKNDGDRHFIGGAQLARLYGVLPTDEVVTFDPRNPTHSKEYQKDHGLNVIHLHPRFKGDYYDIHEQDKYEVNQPTTI